MASLYDVSLQYLKAARVPPAPGHDDPYGVLIETRGGRFTASDVIAVAVLEDIVPPVQAYEAHFIHMRVARAEDESGWAKANFLIGVGGVFHPKAGRFDVSGTPLYDSEALAVWDSYGDVFVDKWAPTLGAGRPARVAAETRRFVVAEMRRFVLELTAPESRLAQVLEDFNCTDEELAGAAAHEASALSVYWAHMNQFKTARALATQMLRRRVTQIVATLTALEGSGARYTRKEI